MTLIRSIPIGFDKTSPKNENILNIFICDIFIRLYSAIFLNMAEQIRHTSILLICVFVIFIRVSNPPTFIILFRLSSCELTGLQITR